MKFIIRILAVAASVFFLPYIVSGIGVSDIKAAIVVSVALAIVNLLIKPIITIITLPLNLITFGLFGLVVNGAVIYFLPAFPFVSGFTVATFWAAFLAALVISAVNWLVSKL